MPSKSYPVTDPNFNSSEQILTVPSTVYTTTLTGLYPSSTYTISVTAINGAGESARSDVLSIYTFTERKYCLMYIL